MLFLARSWRQELSSEEVMHLRSSHPVSEVGKWERMDKLFTPTDANRTLPLVKRIVADILEKGGALRKLGKERDAPAARDKVRTFERELRELMLELESLGCLYKDWGFEMGLVDFPAEIDGEVVYLCWRSDEEELLWYHPIGAGFAGRKQIPSGLLEPSQ